MKVVFQDSLPGTNISIHDDVHDPAFYKTVIEALEGFPGSDLLIEITDNTADCPSKRTLAYYLWPHTIVLIRKRLDDYSVREMRRVLAHEWAHHMGLGHHLIGTTIERDR